MDTTKQLGEDRILTLLKRFSIPAIVGMLVNALYNVVDRIFIGNSVGSDGIAGITVAFPIMIIMMGFAMLIGFGSTSLLSIRLGEKKIDEAERIIANGMSLLIITSLAISVLGLIFLQPVLEAFGASETVMPYSIQYMQIILMGGIFQGIGFGMNNYIRALGSPKTSMLTMLIGALLNIILDPIFIYLFNWGIRGAAIATVFSQLVSSVWVLYYFFGGKSYLKIRLHNMRLHLGTVLKIISLGFPPFIMQIAASIMNTIMNRKLQMYGGDIAISAMGITSSVNMMILMPIFGLNQGAQPIIGYNFGARNFHRVKETVRLGMVGATIIVLIGFALTRIFPAQLVSLFGRDDVELIRIGTKAIRIFLLGLPFVGFQVMTSGYFQAVGKPRQAMLLTLARQVIILIPAILILPGFYGLDGIFAAGPLSDIASAIICGCLLIYEIRSMRKLMESDTLPPPEENIIPLNVKDIYVQ